MCKLVYGTISKYREKLMVTNEDILTEYTYKDGEFRHAKDKARNTKAGTIAGSKDKRDIIIKGKLRNMSKCIWLMETGEWPEFHLEPRNGIKTDIRFSNLREKGSATMETITQEEVLNTFTQNEDGKILRNGKPVETAHRDGYTVVSYKSLKIPTHRLVWFMEHGYMPKVVDHKDNDRTNNKVGNLRATDKGGNMKNLSLAANNSTSGVKGVCYHARDGVWEAYITVDKERMYLGRSKDKEVAVGYREEAEKKYGFSSSTKTTNYYAGTTWKKKVRELKGTGCEVCGSEDGIHIHHIEGFSGNKEKREDEFNGAVLCSTCHKDYHKTHADVNINTYEEWVLNKLEGLEMNDTNKELGISHGC